MATHAGIGSAVPRAGTQGRVVGGVGARPAPCVAACTRAHTHSIGRNLAWPLHTCGAPQPYPLCGMRHGTTIPVAHSRCPFPVPISPVTTLKLTRACVLSVRVCRPLANTGEAVHGQKRKLVRHGAVGHGRTGGLHRAPAAEGTPHGPRDLSSAGGRGWGATRPLHTRALTPHTRAHTQELRSALDRSMQTKWIGVTGAGGPRSSRSAGRTRCTPCAPWPTGGPTSRNPSPA